MSPAHQANRLIDDLPHTSRKRLLASCDNVDLGFGELLCARGDRIRHVYFPEDGFISELLPVDGRLSLEMGLVGNEGMLGVGAALSVNTTSLDALVQGAGRSLRIGVPKFRRELDASPALRRMTHRYIYVLMAQLSQAAACLSFHLLDARLAKWLLMTHDRASSNELRITHELLAQMLGVRRVGVTKAAGLLQERKLLRYNRGEITIIDRAGLERASCSCYRAGRDIYERVMFSKEATVPSMPGRYFRQ
jgi:CRP-like cAMP-binding protein